MHPLIKPQDNFEPSPDFKWKWLSTYKAKIKFDDLKLPGLNQTSSFKTHQVIIFFVLAIELYGIYVLASVLPKPYLALLFTALDFILAIFSHLFKSKLCYAKNLLVLAKNGYTFTTNIKSDGEVRRQKQLIIWYHLYEWLFRCVIIYVAYIKITQTLLYGSFIEGGQLIFICVLYAIAAVIHIIVTGYYLAELWFRYGLFFFGIKKERRLTTERILPTPQKVQFYYKIDLGEKYTNSKCNKHEIVDSEDGKKSIIKIWGILQDAELNTLATNSGGGGIKSQSLAIKLLRIQIKNNGEPALMNEMETPISFDDFPIKK